MHVALKLILIWTIAFHADVLVVLNLPLSHSCLDFFNTFCLIWDEFKVFDGCRLEARLLLGIAIKGFDWAFSNLYPSVLDRSHLDFSIDIFRLNLLLRQLYFLLRILLLCDVLEVCVKWMNWIFEELRVSEEGWWVPHSWERGLKELNAGVINKNSWLLKHLLLLWPERLSSTEFFSLILVKSFDTEVPVLGNQVCLVVDISVRIY